MANGYYQRPPSNIPIPDPSLITASEIAKARAELRVEFRDALKSQEDLLMTAGLGRHEKALLRIDAIEKAAEIFETNLNRVPTQLDREAARLEALFEERLQIKQVQLDESQRFTAAMRDNIDKKIDVAFSSNERFAASQRTALEQQISKSEASYTKELDSLKILLSATKDALIADVNNLTGRLDRGEGDYRGHRQTVEDKRATTTVSTMVIAQVLGVLVLMVMIGGLWVSTHQTGSTADSKRLDELLALTNEQTRQSGVRMETLLSRLNVLLAPLPTK